MNKIQLAGCVIKNKEGKILLIHRNTPNLTQWELPGGKIEDNETPEETAKREVLEELGIEVLILEKLGEKSFEENGFVMDYIWFLAEIKNGNPKVQEEKHDKFDYFSWEELEEMKNQISPNTKNLLEFHHG